VVPGQRSQRRIQNKGAGAGDDLGRADDHGLERVPQLVRSWAMATASRTPPRKVRTVVPGGDAAPLLETQESAFNSVAELVQVLVADGGLTDPVGLAPDEQGRCEAAPRRGPAAVADARHASAGPPQISPPNWWAPGPFWNSVAGQDGTLLTWRAEVCGRFTAQSKPTMALTGLVALAKTLKRFQQLIWNTLIHSMSDAPVRGHQHAPAGADPPLLRLSQPRKVDSYGCAHPRRTMPAAARPIITHESVRKPPLIDTERFKKCFTRR